MNPYNTDSPDTILTCDSVSKSFQNIHALSNVTLTLNRGKIIGLLGSNGSGKSTLLKLINGLLVPDKGEIKIAGHAPGVETKKIISYLPDATYLSKSADSVRNNNHMSIDSYFREVFKCIPNY